jgi:hypothetical protein
MLIVSLVSLLASGALGTAEGTPAPKLGIAIANNEESAPEIAVLYRQLLARGYESVCSRLGLGPEIPATAPDTTALRKMLEEARVLEASFDTVAANAVRAQILEAFDREPQPSKELRNIAGQAAQDIAAGWLTEHQLAKAERAAREAARRFTDTPLDTIRFSPFVMDLLTGQRLVLQADPKLRLSIHSATPGLVYADGTKLGSLDGALEAHLPPGEYRVWLVHAAGMSLPYEVKLDKEPAAVTIDADADARIRRGPPCSLACGSTCIRDLRSIGRRVGASHMAAIAKARGPNDTELIFTDVDVSTGTAHTDLVEPFVASAPRSRFDLRYLIPFGGGQLAQDRPAFAAGYLAVQLSLLAWAAYAVQAQSKTHDNLQWELEESYRGQRNLALGLFVGAVAAGVLEAVIVGAVTGTPDGG